MKTLSFHNLEVGYLPGKSLFELNSPAGDVSFTPGIHGIIAPNGVGKTSFLQTLAGILLPLKGSIHWDSQKIQPGRDVLYFSEYLSFPKYIYPMEWIEYVAGKKPGHELDPWIERFRLKGRMNVFLGMMSHGERRKVNWLAAVLCDKPILLLDEPFNGLDLLAFTAAHGAIEQWRKKGKLVFLVSHQLLETQDFFDDVYVAQNLKWVKWQKAPKREELIRFYSPPGN